MIREEIGNRVREIRLKKPEFTQQKLADAIGCNKSFICRLEAGKQNVTIERLNEICNILDVSLSEFFKPLKAKYKNKDE